MAPQIDEVFFTGVGVIVKKGGKNQLRIFRNEKEAVKSGIGKRIARNLFLGFWDDNCIIRFSIWGNVSCDGSDDCLPGKTCVLQIWDVTTKSWRDYSSGGSAPHVGATWRCKCK